MLCTCIKCFSEIYNIRGNLNLGLQSCWLIWYIHTMYMSKAPKQRKLNSPRKLYFSVNRIHCLVEYSSSLIFFLLLLLISKIIYILWVEIKSIMKRHICGRYLHGSWQMIALCNISGMPLLWKHLFCCFEYFYTLHKKGWAKFCQM